jgi:LmbE family N-acetylglucosaminyl deacetylase
MTRAAAPFLDNSLLVVCHPDDEVLWFGSILRDVGEVIVAYEDYFARPDLGAARRAALARMPRPVTSLALPESGSYGLADWKAPKITPQGLALDRGTRSLREVKRRSLRAVGFPAPDLCAADRYAANFTALLAALRPRVKPGMNVFTHNPWGEYGHEDHIQMFRVLDQLRREVGFTLWMSNYCTERSLTLAKRYFVRNPGPSVRLPVDADYCETVADVYRAHGCWTWAPDWQWFEEERFREAPRGIAPDEPQRHLSALNMFTIDNDAPNRWLKTAGVSSAAAAAAGLGIAIALSEAG